MASLLMSRTVGRHSRAFSIRQTLSTSCHASCGVRRSFAAFAKGPSWKKGDPSIVAPTTNFTRHAGNWSRTARGILCDRKSTSPTLLLRFQRQYARQAIEPTPTEMQMAEKLLGLESDMHQPSMFRAVLFFTAFAAFAFGAAAFWSLRTTGEIADAARNPQWIQLLYSTDRAARLQIRNAQDDFMEDSWGQGISELRLMKMRSLMTGVRVAKIRQWIRDTSDAVGLPAGMRDAISVAYTNVMDSCLSLSPSHKMVIPVIAVNTVVFLLWLRAPWNARLELTMWRYFLHRASSRKQWTTVTATFSHKDFWHFALNNIVLWSFGGGCVYLATHQKRLESTIPEAWPGQHFLAFFATAGVFGATVSQIATAIRFKRAVKLGGFGHAAQTVGRGAGLGSSAAIWSIVAMTACTSPDNRIAFVFFPFLSVPIGYGVAGLIAIDALGVLRGWRMFDHMAHLGGAMFGFLYYQYGIQFWTQVKRWMARLLNVGPYDPDRRKEP